MEHENPRSKFISLGQEIPDHFVDRVVSMLAQKHGLHHVSRDWVQSTLNENYQSFPARGSQIQRDRVELAALLCFKMAMVQDLKEIVNDSYPEPESDAGMAPHRSITGNTSRWNGASLQSVQRGVLQCESVFQIEDFVNLSNVDPKSSQGIRTLKLNLTDGISELAALELQWLGMPFDMKRLVAGQKVRLCPGIEIRQGTFLLTPGKCELIQESVGTSDLWADSMNQDQQQLQQNSHQQQLQQEQQGVEQLQGAASIVPAMSSSFMSTGQLAPTAPQASSSVGMISELPPDEEEIALLNAAMEAYERTQNVGGSITGTLNVGTSNMGELNMGGSNAAAFPVGFSSMGGSNARAPNVGGSNAAVSNVRAFNIKESKTGMSNVGGSSTRKPYAGGSLREVDAGDASSYAGTSKFMDTYPESVGMEIGSGLRMGDKSIQAHRQDRTINFSLGNLKGPKIMGSSVGGTYGGADEWRKDEGACASFVVVDDVNVNNDNDGIMKRGLSSSLNRLTVPSYAGVEDGIKNDSQRGSPFCSLRNKNQNISSSNPILMGILKEAIYPCRAVTIRGCFSRIHPIECRVYVDDGTHLYRKVLIESVELRGEIFRGCTEGWNEMSDLEKQKGIIQAAFRSRGWMGFMKLVPGKETDFFVLESISDTISKEQMDDYCSRVEIKLDRYIAKKQRDLDHR